MRYIEFFWVRFVRRRSQEENVSVVGAGYRYDFAHCPCGENEGEYQKGEKK